MTKWQFELKTNHNNPFDKCAWCQMPCAFELISTKDEEESLITNRIPLCTEHAATFVEMMIEPEVAAMINDSGE